MINEKNVRLKENRQKERTILSKTVKALDETVKQLQAVQFFMFKEYKI